LHKKLGLEDIKGNNIKMDTEGLQGDVNQNEFKHGLLCTWWCIFRFQ